MQMLLMKGFFSLTPQNIVMIQWNQKYHFEGTLDLEFLCLQKVLEVFLKNCIRHVLAKFPVIMSAKISLANLYLYKLLFRTFSKYVIF